MSRVTRVSDRTRIVILGGGFAGAYCAQELQKKLRGTSVEIWLIDRHNYFAFSPLLIEAGTGSVEPRHAVISIRSFSRDAIFRMAEVSCVDLDERLIYYRPTDTEQYETVSYDILVLTLGSVTNLPPVPGLVEYGFQLKSLSDAVALRDRAIRMLERAECVEDERTRRALLHFVFVGGSFTGAEAAGEFEVFLRGATRHYRGVSPRDISVTLIELTDRLLPALDRDLSEYATTKLRKRGIDVRLTESVSEIRSDSVTLGSGEILSASTVVWCAGIAPNPLLATLPLPRDQRGYLLAEPDLRVPGYSNVWAFGDCAVNPSPDGTAYPATAQHAVRQANHAATDISRVLQGQTTRPCNIKTTGSLAALGCRTGVARVFGFKLSGFFAWWMWRTVYFLKMPGWSRKIRVGLDWTIGLLFRRDHVQLGVLGSEGRPLDMARRGKDGQKIA